MTLWDPKLCSLRNIAGSYISRNAVGPVQDIMKGTACPCLPFVPANTLKREHNGRHSSYALEVSQKTENLLNIQPLAEWLNQSWCSRTRTRQELLARRWQPWLHVHRTLPGCRVVCGREKEYACMHTSALGTQSISATVYSQANREQTELQTKENAHQLTLFWNIFICVVHTKKHIKWKCTNAISFGTLFSFN